MASTNIINAVFGSGICAVTTSAFRANYGMVLRFSGIDLPTAFEVDFSNYDVMGRDSITAIGQNGEVQIPDDLWDSGLNIYAYVYLHPTDNSGVTVYTVTIPVLGRPNRTEEQPTPHEQSVIEQAISALNEAVEQTAADVETTTANAQAAAQSEANSATSERAAAASAGAALASQNAAESASQSATQSASNAAESARNAAQSASQAAESATNAQESAEQAERSVQSISDDVERSERAAQTATEKATEAVSSAATASSKANEAAQSASSAASAAQNAASSATAAQSSATDAEQAKQDAQDAQEAAETAQAAAEQAAQSVSGLSAQITQNTADIADLVQSKAGVLVDTASGSIASFVPDATVPTVKGLTVNVEPVQRGSGDPSPDNIRPISGLDAVEVQRTAINVWDEEMESGRISATGQPSEIASWIRTKNFISVKPNTAYYRKSPNNIQLFWYDAEQNFLSYANWGTGAITSPSNAYYVKFHVDQAYGTTYNNDISINYPSTDTAYHSGTDNATYQIQLGQTVYGGTVDAVNGVLTVTHGLFAPTTNTQIVRQPGRAYYYFNVVVPGIANTYVESGVISNIIKSGPFSGGNSVWTGSADLCCLRERSFSFYTDATKEMTGQESLQWLINNGAQIYYPLATPITISLSPLEISVLTGQTNNIWADSGDVSVDYAADLKTYIDQKIAAAVAALS